MKIAQDLGFEGGREFNISNAEESMRSSFTLQLKAAPLGGLEWPKYNLLDT